MKKKLDIAIALSHGAELLIFDEATSGLDLVIKKTILEILKKEILQKKITIIFLFYDINEIEGFVDEVLILKKGRKVLYDTIENLHNNYYTVYDNKLEHSLIRVLPANIIQKKIGRGEVMRNLKKQLLKKLFIFT